MRLIHLVAWLVGAALSISACTIIDPPSVELRADQPDLDASYGRLVEGVNAYLSMQTDLFERDPQRFFAEGYAVLADLREAQGVWEADVRAADLPETAQEGLPSAAAADEFTIAMDEWLSAQEEQARMSEDCWSSYDPQSCYASMLSTKSSTWAAASARVNAAIQRMAAEVAE